MRRVICVPARPAPDSFTSSRHEGARARVDSSNSTRRLHGDGPRTQAAAVGPDLSAHPLLRPAAAGTGFGDQAVEAAEKGVLGFDAAVQVLQNERRCFEGRQRLAARFAPQAPEAGVMLRVEDETAQL